MKAERWRRLRELFTAAAERSVGEQQEYLQKSCPDDDALREEVLDLLRSETRADTLLRGAVSDAAADTTGVTVEVPGILFILLGLLIMTTAGLAVAILIDREPAPPPPLWKSKSP